MADVAAYKAGLSGASNGDIPKLTIDIAIYGEGCGESDWFKPEKILMGRIADAIKRLPTENDKIDTFSMIYTLIESADCVDLPDQTISFLISELFDAISVSSVRMGRIAINTLTLLSEKVCQVRQQIMDSAPSLFGLLSSEHLASPTIKLLVSLSEKSESFSSFLVDSHIIPYLTTIAASKVPTQIISGAFYLLNSIFSFDFAFSSDHSEELRKLFGRIFRHPSSGSTKTLLSLLRFMVVSAPNLLDLVIPSEFIEILPNLLIKSEYSMQVVAVLYSSCQNVPNLIRIMITPLTVMSLCRLCRSDISENRLASIELASSISGMSQDYAKAFLDGDAALILDKYTERESREKAAMLPLFLSLIECSPDILELIPNSKAMIFDVADLIYGFSTAEQSPALRRLLKGIYTVSSVSKDEEVRSLASEVLAFAGYPIGSSSSM